MIRLGHVRVVVTAIKQWCRTTVPLLITARLYSSNPRDWCLFLLGWKCVVAVSYEWTANRQHLTERYLGNDDDDTDGNCTGPSKKVTTRRGTPNDGPDLLTRQYVPIETYVTICSYLHPRDITKLACLNTVSSIQANDNLLWRQLWFRDYGTVLLRWTVGRRAIARSLLRPDERQEECKDYFGEHDDNEVNRLLEVRLQEHFDTPPPPTASSPRHQSYTKEFYFTFGEIYINYVLARHNRPSHCLLGMHGHVFNFTNFADYHPGLTQPILLECGRDATRFFEDVPHSSGARAVAAQLCVVVNQSCFGESEFCGLYLPCAVKGLRDVLRESNTRLPVSKLGRGGEGKRGGIRSGEGDQWMRHCVVPRTVCPPQRPPTLERVRREWDGRLQRHEKEQRRWTARMTKEAIMNCVRRRGVDRCWQKNQRQWQFYYDPFQREWMKWDSSPSPS